IVSPNPLEIILSILLGSGFGLPSSVPPTAEDPIAANVAPAECIFYVSWTGTGKPDAASGNSCERLLAEPAIQNFLAQNCQRALALISNSNPNSGFPLDINQLNELLELISGKPGAFFISDIQSNGNNPPIMNGGGVLRVGENANQLKSLLETFQSRALKDHVSSVQIQNHSFSRLHFDQNFPKITWGIVGNHLIFGFGDNAIESLLQRIDGPVPGWLTDIRSKLPVPRPASVTYMNVDQIMERIIEASNQPEVAQMIHLLGLDSVQSIANVSGLDEQGYVTRSLLSVNDAGRGLLSWIEAKPLTADDLNMIGHDVPIAVAFKLDPARVYDLWLDVVQLASPHDARQFQQSMEEFKQHVGISIRDDLLFSLGDSWRIFAQPGASSLMNGWTAVISIRDPNRLATAHETLFAFLEKSLADSGGPHLKSNDTNGRTVYTLELGQIGAPLAPSWCINGKELYITLMTQTLDQILKQNGNDSSLVELPLVHKSLNQDKRTLALAYIDTKRVVEMLTPLARMGLQQMQRMRPPFPLDTSNLPPIDLFLKHLQPTTLTVQRTSDGMLVESHHTLPGGNVGTIAPVAVALLLPAVASSREAARRVQGMNQMKQIGLALHNYAAAKGAFPAGYNADEDGKPLLSWRVHVLPYIEDGGLYNEFHLDEPWDSPHNRALIDKMPAIYRSPKSQAKPGMTNYLGVGGADGIFVRPQKGNQLGTSFHDIRDGTSNTIMIVEVPDESAMIWTKPGDFAPDKKDPSRGLIGMHSYGFLAGYADGLVLIIAKDMDPGILKAMFTKSGGEAVANGLLEPAKLEPAKAAPAPKAAPALVAPAEEK
ncbi:MAG: DUF1559 domain-containing protein, partial [Pirellulales bacterium]|nr:DUF1559 domain-containing protein [Pirellulales bacterium]